MGLVGTIGSILLLLLSGNAWADAIANIHKPGQVFRSPSNQASAIYTQGCFEVSFKGKRLYRSEPLEPEWALGRLMISDNGRDVVWMLEEHYYVQPQREEGLPALVFYQNGKALKKYTLTDLLIRMNWVSESVSHIEWVLTRRDPNGTPIVPAVQFAGDGSRLEFETTSFRHYVFDPGRARLLVAEDTAVYAKADLIAYGKCEPQGDLQTPGPWKVKVIGWNLLKGELDEDAELVFLDPSRSFSGGYHAVALQRKGPDWTASAAEYEIPVLYNRLTD